MAVYKFDPKKVREEAMKNKQVPVESVKNETPPKTKFVKEAAQVAPEKPKVTKARRGRKPKDSK